MGRVGDFLFYSRKYAKRGKKQKNYHGDTENTEN